MFKLFTRKKQLQRKQAIIDSLKAQNSRLRVEIADNRDKYDKAIEALNMECEDLTKEVKENESIITQLRQQIADNRDEYENALEAKEAERLEICDQLGVLQEQRRKDKDTIERQANTIGRLIKENAWLIKTNANLSSKLNIKRGADGRFVSTKKDHE